MNRGDTTHLILNYQINGEDLQKDAYEEIELQINKQGSFNSVKKKMSLGEIVYGDVTYISEGIEKTFTGYYTQLTQEETFKLSSGKSNVQLRIMVNDEVGSSAISDITIGNTLSSEVLNATTT